MAAPSLENVVLLRVHLATLDAKYYYTRWRMDDVHSADHL